jgi:predicted metalloprotease
VSLLVCRLVATSSEQNLMSTASAQHGFETGDPQQCDTFGAASL